jgi:hypothetical protein
MRLGIVSVSGEVHAPDTQTQGLSGDCGSAIAADSAGLSGSFLVSRRWNLLHRLLESARSGRSRGGV